MLTVTITEKGGKPLVRDFDQAEITIGRVQGNDIVLPKSNVSKQHAHIAGHGGKLMVHDDKSTNGTYVNGKRIAAPYELHPGDKVFVGDFVMEVRLHIKPAAEPARSPRATSAQRQAETKELESSGELVEAPEPEHEDPAEVEADGAGEDAWGAHADDAPDAQDATPMPAARATARRPPSPMPAHTHSAAARPLQSRVAVAPRTAGEALEVLYTRLIAHLIAHPVGTLPLNDPQLDTHMRQVIHEIALGMRQANEIPAGVSAEGIANQAAEESSGMGPLNPLMADGTVTEILVNGAQTVYCERRGRLEMTDVTFTCEAAVKALVTRIAISNGRHVDLNAPLLDGRLFDGSRINAVISPISLQGTSLTMRRFSQTPLMVDDLVAGGSFNADMAEFLENCVQLRRNIVVAGGTGSGKTTLLNVLSGFISENERIVTIEDSAELRLDQIHVVTLEARPPTREFAGISIRDLVRNSLRMRPDRIVVGECRGGEALDMLQAMNTGHDGSLTTIHANSPRDVLARLETMVLMSGMELPVRAIREQVASAIDIIVQQARFSDGSRRVTHISEIVGMEGEVISMHDLFTFETQGITPEGKVQGRYRSSGYIPKFYEELRAMGMQPNLAIFRKS